MTIEKGSPIKNPKTFGEKLRNKIWERRLRVVDVAAGTGISKGMISQYMNDNCQPSIGNVLLLEKFLKFKHGELSKKTR